MSYTRHTTTGAPRVLDNNKYYAFGMNHLNQLTMPGYSPLSVPYNYKYSGKELQETGMYDFGWRHYMPDIGRWNGMDQLSEMYAPVSPYAYVANNPVSFSDPDGRKIKKNGEGSWTFDGADLNMILAYLTNGGDFGNLTSQLESFGDNFGSGPLSNFWGSFDSGGVLAGGKIVNGNVVWTQHNYLEGSYVGSEIVSQAIYSISQEVKKGDSGFDAGDMVGGIGLMVDGGSFSWDNLSNKKQWRYSYKTHKFLKGRGYKIKTSAIKGSVPKVFKGAGTATLVVGTIMDINGVIEYRDDPNSPDAVHPAEAGINLAIGVYGMRMNPIFGVFYTVTDILHPQGFWGAWGDNVNIHHEFRETNGFPLRIER